MSNIDSIAINGLRYNIIDPEIADMLENIETPNTGNICNPSLFQKLDYYYNVNTGEHRDNTYNRVWITPDFIEVGEVPMVLYSRALETFQDVMDILCWDSNESYLGAVASITPFSTTDEQRIILKSGTRKIKIQMSITTDDCTPAKLCLSFEHLDEFTAYGDTEPEVRIKNEYLSSVEETVLNELTDVDMSINLVNPALMKCWGLKYAPVGTYEDNSTPANETYQMLKGKIDTNGAIDVYAIVRTVVSGGGGTSLTINCWDGSGTWLNKVTGSISTTDLQHLTLPSGTAEIGIEVNAPSWYFDAADLCVSFQEIEEFVPYEITRKLKSSLIGDVDGLTLAGKNVVFFGDSLVDNRVPDYFGQITKAHTYPLGIGGTSASDRSPGSDSAYGHHLCGYAIAHAINTGDWSALLTSAQGTTRSSDYTKILACSQIDWSKIDIIYLHYGANDTYDDTDNANDPMDVTCYAGSIRYIITQIQTAYPNIRIFVGSVINSINQPKPSRAQAQGKLKEVCDEYHVGYIDNFTNLGINDMTASAILTSPLIHPSFEGQKMFASWLAHNIW